MKLRLLPIAISLAVSAFVLFGGWFMYHSVAMENPLQQKVNAVDGVEKAVIGITGSAVHIELTLDPVANLRKVYQEIATQGASIIGSRSLHITIKEQTSEELEQWWSHALFDVAEAMETKHYADIPDSLKQAAATLPGLSIETDMDNTNVYIQLHEGKYRKSIILARTPLTIGVWTND